LKVLLPVQGLPLISLQFIKPWRGLEMRVDAVSFVPECVVNEAVSSTSRSRTYRFFFATMVWDSLTFIIVISIMILVGHSPNLFYVSGASTQL
jgi:hypothetical protein